MNFITEHHSDRFDICDGLIDYWRNNEKKRGHSLYDETVGVHSHIKESTDATITSMTDITIAYNDHILQPAIDKHVERYVWSGKTSPWGVVEYPNIQHYAPNEGFHQYHMERSNAETSKRHLVFMTYLNDVEEGGETEFLYQQCKITPVKGKTLIWPSDWTHVHRGIPAPKEDKYIITGWLSYKE